MDAVSLPPVFVPVIVYDAEDVTAVGFPLMTPVEESMASPAGRLGETVQPVTVPPVEVGVTAFIAVPFVSVNVDGL